MRCVVLRCRAAPYGTVRRRKTTQHAAPHPARKMTENTDLLRRQRPALSEAGASSSLGCSSSSISLPVQSIDELLPAFVAPSLVGVDAVVRIYPFRRTMLAQRSPTAAPGGRPRPFLTPVKNASSLTIAAARNGTDFLRGFLLLGRVVLLLHELGLGLKTSAVVAEMR